MEAIWILEADVEESHLLRFDLIWPHIWPYWLKFKSVGLTDVSAAKNLDLSFWDIFLFHTRDPW